MKLYFFIIKILMQMNSSCYKIENSKHIKEHLATFKDYPIKISQLKNCYAFVYELPDSSITVLAQQNNQKDSKGIIFNNMDCFNNSFNEAIKELKYDNNYLIHKEIIFDIDQNINLIMSQLGGIINKDGLQINEKNIYNYYVKSKAIQDENLRKKFIFFKYNKKINFYC